MAERTQKLVIALLVVAALAGLYWGVQQLPWPVEEVDKGFSEAARRNPFLAAQRFLEKNDVPVTPAKGVSHLDDLPDPAGATLILFSNEGMLSRARVDALWQWVEAGGHLILNANSYTDKQSGANRNLILQDLGLGAYPAADTGPGHTAFDSMVHWFGQRQAECLDAEHVLSLETGDGEKPLDIALRSNMVLVNHSELETIAAANDDGNQLLRYFIGDGMVTVTTRLSFWHNRYIACYDHAYLLWQMLGPGEVLILYHAQVPSLFTLLWRNAAFGVSLALLLLALWLWRRGRRFGPLQQQAEAQRRRLGEHLFASAMFAWRWQKIAPQVQGLRRAIKQIMERRHPGFRRLTGEQQFALIGRLSGCDAGRVAWAFAQQDIQKAQQLTELVQQLQQIRNRL